MPDLRKINVLIEESRLGNSSTLEAVVLRKRSRIAWVWILSGGKPPFLTCKFAELELPNQRLALDTHPLPQVVLTCKFAEVELPNQRVSGMGA